MQHNRSAAPGRKEWDREALDRAFSTFAGMEGGNPAAAVWICDAMPLFLGMPLPLALQGRPEPDAWDAAYRRRHAHLLPRWQTHYRIARVMASARAAALPPGRSLMSAPDYFHRHLYAPRGWEFKLNLFPLPERLDAALPWTKVFAEQPELRSRPAFLRLCREGGRFRFLHGLRQRHRPRVLLCLGERHRHDYLRAFGLQDVAGSEAVLQPADTTHRLQIFQHEGTTLVVAPSFGGVQGLSSDVLLEALGTFLAQWLRATDFPPLLDEVEQPGAPAAGPLFPQAAGAVPMHAGAAA